MKTMTFLCLGAIALICTSCERANPPGLPNGEYPFLHYDLLLGFQDAGGNDLVKGLEVTEPAGSIQTDFVAPGQYVLSCSPDRYELGFGPKPGAIYDNLSRYPKLLLVKPEPGISDNYLLGVSMDSYKKDDLEKITYLLTCPHVFGDQQTHEIVTRWEKSDSAIANDDNTRVCRLVAVDGKEFSAVSDPLHGQISPVTVVLDR